jgi:hypothetical protein
MVVAACIILGLLAAGGVFVIAGGGGAGKFSWVDFYVRGKESGFKLGEINLLRKVAVENQLKDPGALYWSERQLDRCIRDSITLLRDKGALDSPKSVNFLIKLFDFRKQVEFNLPKYRVGLRSSRDISPGQKIRISWKSSGSYDSLVKENMSRHISISLPEGPPLPAGRLWQGQKIGVSFWRAEDAGYFFESEIIAEVQGKAESVLHLSHSDTIVRTQKRGSIRLMLTESVRVYPLVDIAAANEAIETQSGYQGKMIDLSEDGFAVTIGGKVRAGLPVKIQLFMNDTYVVMCGAVKHVTYNQKNNQSIVHAQAVKPSNKMRIAVLSQVYGIFNEKPVLGKTQEPSSSALSSRAEEDGGSSAGSDYALPEASSSPPAGAQRGEVDYRLPEDAVERGG